MAWLSAARAGLVLADEGLLGNMHLPFANLNNAAVAGLLPEFLAEDGLG